MRRVAFSDTLPRQKSLLRYRVAKLDYWRLLKLPEQIPEVAETALRRRVEVTDQIARRPVGIDDCGELMLGDSVGGPVLFLNKSHGQ